MPERECYHCGKTLTEAERSTHDCWTTTEENLTRDLSEDLMDAWLRLREEATAFGEQRVYASHKSIMFARKHCYFFVRPKKNVLEVCFFLTRTVKAPQIRKIHQTSKVKVAHLLWVKHRDEVEGAMVEWLREAYGVEDQPKLPVAKGTSKKQPVRESVRKKTRSKKSKAKKIKPKKKNGRKK